MFYIGLIFGIASPTLKVLFGRKNVVRLIDIIGGVPGVVAIAWLYIVFPFEFAYFADVLPEFLRFLVQWITNDIARILIILGTVVALINAIYNAILYVLVRRELDS